MTRGREREPQAKLCFVSTIVSDLYANVSISTLDSLELVIVIAIATVIVMLV